MASRLKAALYGSACVGCGCQMRDEDDPMVANRRAVEAAVADDGARVVRALIGSEEARRAIFDAIEADPDGQAAPFAATEAAQAALLAWLDEADIPTVECPHPPAAQRGLYDLPPEGEGTLVCGDCGAERPVRGVPPRLQVLPPGEADTPSDVPEETKP